MQGRKMNVGFGKICATVASHHKPNFWLACTSRAIFTNTPSAGPIKILPPLRRSKEMKRTRVVHPQPIPPLAATDFKWA